MPRLTPGGLEEHEGQKGKKGGVGSYDQLAEGVMGVGPSGMTPAEYLKNKEIEARKLGYDVVIGHPDLIAIAFDRRFVNVGYVTGIINDMLEDSGMRIKPEFDGMIYDPITNLKIDLRTDASPINIPIPSNFALFILGNKMEARQHPVKGTANMTTDGVETTYQKIFLAAIFYSVVAVLGPKIFIQVFKRFLVPFAAGAGTRRYKRKVLDGIQDNSILMTQMSEDVVSILNKLGGVSEKDLRLIRKLKLFMRET
uniref:Uncharacterized protein n=1 Tax=viral metagenome TaxID=1070528 RepID=A0A2V0RGW4_9ZZZZ